MTSHDNPNGRGHFFKITVTALGSFLRDPGWYSGFIGLRYYLRHVPADLSIFTYCPLGLFYFIVHQACRLETTCFEHIPVQQKLQLPDRLCATKLNEVAIYCMQAEIICIRKNFDEFSERTVTLI